jgi:tetratricopeptide (TPR) repeat protein
MQHDKVKTIIYVFGIVILLVGFAGKPSQKTKNDETRESGGGTIMIIGATQQQSDAFESRQQKVHEQWEHIRVAGKLEDAGDYKAAIEEYKIALQLAKTKGDTAVPLGSLLEVYGKNGDYGLALETLDQLILLKPSLAIKYAERRQNLLEAVLRDKNNQKQNLQNNQ